MRKKVVDRTVMLLEDLIDGEDPELIDEFSKISALEFLVSAGLMSGELDSCDLIEFARYIEPGSDFMRALANGNGELEGFIPEVKDHLKSNFPNVYCYLEELYGGNCESTISGNDSKPSKI